MKKLVAIFGLLVVVSIVVSAEEPNDAEITGNYRNGRYWNSLSEAEKIRYMVGFGEGLKFGALCVGEKGWEWILGQSTVGEMVTGLNAFYVEPANARIGIIGALRWYQMKVKGSSAEQLRKYLETLRTGAAKHEDRSRPR